ncbi:hypothetical protein ABFT80_25520 [Mesorhizobium sp. SB112]
MPLKEIRVTLGDDISDAELIQMLFNQTVPTLIESVEHQRLRAQALVDLLGGSETERAHLTEVLETSCIRHADA